MIYLYAIKDKLTGMFEKKNHYSPYSKKEPNKKFYFTKTLAFARLFVSKRAALAGSYLPDRFKKGIDIAKFVVLPEEEYLDLLHRAHFPEFYTGEPSA